MHLFLSSAKLKATRNVYQTSKKQQTPKRKKQMSKKQYIDWIEQVFDTISGWVENKTISRDEVTRMFMRHKLLKCR